MKKMLFVGLLIAIALSACSGGGSSVSIDGQWKLVSYGSSSDQKPALPDVETSIEFKDGQLSGNVGCNSFGGDYKVKGNTMELGPIMTTEMYCEAVAEQESGTYAVLQGSVTFMLDGNTLTITSADGNSSIVLERK